MTKEAVIKILKKIVDSHVGVNIYDAGMVEELKVSGKKVSFKLRVPSMGCSGCPSIQFMVDEIKGKLNKKGYESDISVAF